MAGALRRLRLPSSRSFFQTQKAKRARKPSAYFVRTSLLVILLSYPLSYLFSPDDGQGVHRKQTVHNEYRYRETWQKEHRRLQQLNQETRSLKPGPVSTSDSKTQRQVKTDAFFVPMTWLRECTPEHYSFLDPEWQQFLALAKDNRRQQKLKARLARLVLEEINKLDMVTKSTGKPLRLQRAWLDFQFPNTQPPQYECSGLLWSDNKLSWATKMYDAREALRACRILMPNALLSSFQSFFSTHLAAKLGSFTSPWSSSSETENGRQSLEESTSSLFPQTPAQQEQQEQQGASPGSFGERQKDHQSKTPPLTISTFAAGLVREMMPQVGPDSATSNALQSFKTTFKRQGHLPQPTFFRGACDVVGEVGISGPTGRCKVYIMASYSPNVDTFVATRIIGIYMFPSRQVSPGPKES